MGDDLRQGIALQDGRILMLVPQGSLQIDHTYQRGVVPGCRDDIAANFNPSALGILQVCRRKKTGILNVVDGQNRLAAIRLRLESDWGPTPDELLCLITPDTTRVQEAELFVTLNSHRPVTGNSKFRANLLRGHEPEKTIAEIMAREEFELAFPQKRPNEREVGISGIYGLGSLMAAYKSYVHHVPVAARLLKEIGGGGHAARVPFVLRTGDVIHGLAAYLKDTGDEAGEALKKALKSKKIDLSETWVDLKKQTGSGYVRPRALAQALAYYAFPEGMPGSTK